MYIKVCPISDKTVINLHTRLKKDKHTERYKARVLQPYNSLSLH